MPKSNSNFPPGVTGMEDPIQGWPDWTEWADNVKRGDRCLAEGKPGVVTEVGEEYLAVRRDGEPRDDMFPWEECGPLEDSPYPEHEKLLAVKAESQSIGEFLDWLQNEQGVALARFHNHGEECSCTSAFHEGEPPPLESELCPVCRGLYEDRLHVCDSYDGQLMPVHLPINDWLAVYFNIDERKLDEEKRDMLQRARKGGAHD